MKSVLIIDDNIDIVDSMMEGMDMFGIEVVGKAYDGLEGIEQFKKLNPDIVLLDIMMPDYDGFYLLDEQLIPILSNTSKLMQDKQTQDSCHISFHI